MRGHTHHRSIQFRPNGIKEGYLGFPYTSWIIEQNTLEVFSQSDPVLGMSAGIFCFFVAYVLLLRVWENFPRLFRR